MAIGRIDRTPASSGYEIRHDKKDVVWDLDVRGDYAPLLGKISIRARGDLASGRLVPLTLAIGESLEK